MAVVPLRYIFFFIILSMTDANSASRHETREPICSKFHYEENLLEKMIRLEHSTSLLMEEFRNIKTEVGNTLVTVKQAIEDVKTVLDRELETQRNTREEMKLNVNKATEEMEAKIQEEIQSNKDVHAPEKGKDVKSAFTVTNPVAGSTSNTLRFTRAVTNIGQHYSTSTGIFTCEHPGIYVFLLQILQQNTADHAACLIRQNSVSKRLEAHSNTLSSGKGYFSSSMSVVLQLARGDEVDVYCRSGLASIHPTYTSFSGFLNKAD